MAAALHAHRRIVRPATILSALVFTSASPLVAQTLPISGPVSRGLPRQIVTSRTDAQLTSLITAGARSYTVYRFEYGGRMDRARIRRWTGVLLMPQPADLGKLGPVGVATPRGGKATDTWYSHADGTLSKLVLDPAGRTAGVLSVRGPSMWVNMDINRDGYVDFFRMVSIDGTEVVAAMVGEGAAFLERWRLGENTLCNPRNTGIRPGISDRKEDPASPFGSGAKASGGTVPMCGQTSENSGPLAGITRDNSTGPEGIMDRICEGRTSRPRLPGPGPLFDGPVGSAAVGAAGVGGAAGRQTAAERSAAEREAMARSFGYFTEQVYIQILKPPKTEKNPHRDATLESETPSSERSTPLPDEAASSDAAMNQLCAGHERSKRRWGVTIAEAERQQRGAGDTNCDDPVTDPAAADAEKTLPKCGPSRDSQSVSEQLLAGLGAYQSRQCGRFEQPGADGTCRGGRTLTGNRGQVWYGFGSVIGLVPCDGIICDPRGESR